MKISLVNGMCVRHDAISETIRGTFMALAETPGIRPRLFTYASEFPEIDTKIVFRPQDILFDKHFLSSDLIIYHFGIYHALFNAILLGNGHAPQVVRYHNVTPKAFLPQQQHSLIDKSMRQVANMVAATRIWADSSFNKQHLVEYGLPAAKIDVSPLYVKDGYAAVDRAAKPRDYVRILYVGRFVRSKGVIDLIEAVAAMRAVINVRFSVELVGNVSFSDPAYLATLRELIKRRGLEPIVLLTGQLDDEALWQRYLQSHVFVMPSYHEGFCVPAVEALRAHCVPIAYASGNLVDLLDGVGDVIEPGSLSGLTERLTQHVAFFDNFNRTGDQNALLPLSSGAVPLRRFDALVQSRISEYSYSAFCDRLMAAVRHLAEPILSESPL